jgi:two-component system CheB/CheR fusion protein
MSYQKKSNFERMHQKVMARRYAPGSVIINENEDVLHATGNVEQYVSYRRGEPTRNILAMVISDLRQPLRNALYRAKKEETDLPVHTQVQTDGKDKGQVTELIVDRLKEKDFPDDLMLIVFRKVSHINEKPIIKKEELSGEEGEIIDELENELKQTREQLQMTVEDYETANEELRSSNEELQSMNEELQSTTEELETSREELQSVNEELKTVNQELETKVDELRQSNDDLQNLIEATEIAIVFVDRNFRLKRFTSKATDLFNLEPFDMGRPLGYFTHRLVYDSLHGGYQRYA